MALLIGPLVQDAEDRERITGALLVKTGWPNAARIAAFAKPDCCDHAAMDYAAAVV